MVIRALIGIAFSLVLMGLAQHAWQLLCCRLLQGACGGVEEAAAAYVGSEPNERRQSRRLGGLYSAMAGGALLGPLLGAWAIAAVGFRPVLITLGALIAVLAFVMILMLPEAQPRGLNAYKGASLWRTSLLLLNHRRRGAVLVSVLCGQLALYRMVTVFASLLEQALQDASSIPMWIGTLQATLWGAAMIGGRWWSRWNERQPAEVSLLYAMVGAGAALLFQAIPQECLWLFPARLVQGFCVGALIPSLQLLVLEEAANRDQGTWMGMTASTITLGQILGSVVAGVAAEMISPREIVALMGCVSLIGAAVLVFSPCVWMAKKASV
jgi:MFS family permease